MNFSKRHERKINPRETANIFSFFTFSYTIGLFKKGFTEGIGQKDIYQVLTDSATKDCGDKTEVLWKNKSVIGILWNRFGKTYVILGLIHLIWTIFYSVVQPYAMSRFIVYFRPNQTEISRADVYYYASIVLGLNVFHCFYIHNYRMFEYRVNIQIKSSLSSLLYRKILKISPTAISSTSIGNIVTILTKDIKTIEDQIWMINDTLVAIIQTFTLCLLLYYRMGNPAFIGIGMLLLALPIQVILGKVIMSLKLKIGQMSDVRLQLTQEAFSAIRIIKMYGWEQFFNAKIHKARMNETTSILKAFYINVIIVIIGIMCSKITFLVFILSYIWMGYATTTELIFYILSLFKDLIHSLGITIPMGIATAAEFYAAHTRLTRLLTTAELKKEKLQTLSNNKPRIDIENASVCFNKHIILNEVNLKIFNSGLTIVTGSIGSGKTSLLKTILKEYPLADGRLSVNGSVSYASQESWLFPSSIKQNILFGQTFDNSRYKKVIDICALKLDFSTLADGDETILTDRGMNLSKGQQSRVNLARAIYRQSDIYLLDDCLSALDSRVQNFIFEECIKKFLKDKLVIFITHNSNHILNADRIVTMEQGTIKSIQKPNTLGEKTLKENYAAEKSDHSKECLSNTEVADFFLESKKDDGVRYDVYKKYVDFGGGIVVFGFIMVIYIISQYVDSFSYKLITTWVDFQQNVIDMETNGTSFGKEYDEAITKKDYTFNIYAILTVTTLVIALVKTFSVLGFCRKASINIHQTMVHTVLHAYMDFFDKHFIGNILNRFSLDLYNVDEGLPFIFLDFFRVMFAMVGSIILLATIKWTFLLASIIFMTLLVILRAIYLPTGRNLKRLEAINRSPLINHINTSLEGLTTIRAYGAEDTLTNEFDKHQDHYTSTYYMSMTTMRAFGFFMDCLCSLFVIFVVLVFLFIDSENSAGNVGLGIIQVMMLSGMVQVVVRQWTNIENQMTSVERALEYTDIKQEDFSGPTVTNWPKSGELKYENVVLSYDNKGLILNNINFIVMPQQKIGVVGRTGAGKSSIISTLFRLYDFQGNIYIDGSDIKKISLQLLRKSIGIIPQDPIVFSGTIRENLDPLHVYSDAEIWDAIKRAGVKDINKLESTVFEINLSSGQKQLLCLARIILRKNKIVVLDEVTANVDPETDLLIHDVIKEQFSFSTIITVAHRLQSIINCDMILVLDKGQIVEFDKPQNILKNKDSLFYKMIEQCSIENNK